MANHAIMGVRRWCKRKAQTDGDVYHLEYPCYDRDGFILIAEACDLAGLGIAKAGGGRNGPASRPKLSVGYRLLYALAQKGMDGWDQGWKDAMMPQRSISLMRQKPIVGDNGVITRHQQERSPSFIPVPYTPQALLQFISLFKANWVS